MSDPRYPIGRFTPDLNSSPETRACHIGEIASLPSCMRVAVSGLSPEQLNTPYREGGWTVRQLVHHVPDSHLNAYIRCKLALTEETPTIKPYDENAWAKLKDSELTPIEVSLALLEATHARWITSAAFAPARGLPAPIQSSRGRGADPGLAGRTIRLAWQPSPRPHHVTQGKNEVVSNFGEGQRT